jgi:RHS repeat-associated protein
MTVGSTTTTYQYNALDQLTSAGAVTYQYDDRGNLNKITNGTQNTNYTYNAADQLSNVILPNNTYITYGYDGDGRRVKQTVSSTVTNYQWDEASSYGDVVNEYNSSGTLASYVLGGTGLISQTRGTTTSYFLQDGQGSTRTLTNTNNPATVTDTYSYTAFGENFTHTGPTTNPYQYTGQQFDSLTSLYSLRARYYNPALGRFLSQDSYRFNLSNPAELNRYVYTGNDPINRADPTGLFAFVEYSMANSESEEEGAALEPIGKEFASEGEGAVNELFSEFDDEFWNAISRNAGDLGEETTTALAQEFSEEAASVEGTSAPGTWLDYVLEEDPGRVLRAFKVEPQAIKLDQPLTAYRYWSGDPAREIGNWLTLNPNLTPEEARALLALPNNNLAINVTEFIIPNDTVILIGEAASQTAEEWAGSYAIGGGFQIYLPDPLILIMP